MTVKYFCDACGVEIEHRLREIELSYQSGGKTKYYYGHLCEKCFSKAESWIKRFLAAKRRAEP